MRISRLFFFLLFFFAVQFSFAQTPNRFGEKEEKVEKKSEKKGESPPEESTEKEPEPKPKTPKKKQENIDRRLFFGGNLGASFGSYTYFELNPRVYYMFSEKLIGTGGITYQYVNIDPGFYGPASPRIETNNYGFQLGAIYELFRPIILQAEFETINWEPFENDRVWSRDFFVGGGFWQRSANGRGGVFVVYMYNLSADSPYTPYSQPYILRIGVSF